MRKSAESIPDGFVAVSAHPEPGALSPALQVTIGTGQRCPFCRGPLLREDALAACVACLTVAHRACVAEHGGCTTLGCARVQATPAPRAARRKRRRSPGAGWAVAAGLAGGLLGAAAWTARGPRLEPPLTCAPLPAPAPEVRRDVVERRTTALCPPDVDLDRAPGGDGPRVELEPGRAVQGTTLLLHGSITAAAGRVHVVVRGPAGAELAWDAAPGPFEAAVTLPGPGEHELSVVVSDEAGRATTERRMIVCAAE